MWPKTALVGGEGASGPGPAPRPGRVAAGRQLPAAFSAVVAETNDSTDEEEKIELSMKGGGTWNRGLVFLLGVWFLLSGWVTMLVWNVVGQRVG